MADLLRESAYLAAAFGDTAYVRAPLERDRSQANQPDTQWSEKSRGRSTRSNALSTNVVLMTWRSGCAKTGLMSRHGEANWGEGILAGPANAGDLDLIEVLIRCGARVPDVTRWGRYYYFKHANVARYLLEHGTNANVEKTRMLLDYGAAVDATIAS